MREVDLANRQDSAATGETAAFTLMGVRYYNWVTGTFTSPDPVPGGNDTSYTYPNDPINQQDVSGQWWRWVRNATRWTVRHRGTIATVAGIGACLGGFSQLQLFASDGRYIT